MNVNVDYEKEGVVFNIQRFSLNDGPGIRTILFLKGCPLSCLWCSNPESQKIRPVTLYDVKKCIHCGRCLGICPHGALGPQFPTFIDYERCVGCGECEAVCPAGALVRKGKPMTIQQVIRELKKDAPTYRNSGGGITLSGGEPLTQFEFSAEVFKACQYQGWHTAIETTGYTFNEEALEMVFKYVDLALLDIKCIDEGTHMKYTGVSNEIILHNAKKISQMTETIVRVPTIPGFNASPEEITRICEFTKTLTGVKMIHLLPYHALGSNKYAMMGRPYEMEGIKPPEKELMNTLKTVVESHGLSCKIGG
ncbi:glycyl-radical enzyme activating protein [Eubacterium sp.]|uniref:glycyl-radical enzyme activating protein n=1 Tax=Eubacterium sp. TaxID=142586 RepID=UPI002FC5C951